jgi:hypothetical protein
MPWDSSEKFSRLLEDDDIFWESSMSDGLGDFSDEQPPRFFPRIFIRRATDGLDDFSSELSESFILVIGHGMQHRGFPSQPPRFSFTIPLIHFSGMWAIRESSPREAPDIPKCFRINTVCVSPSYQEWSVVCISPDQARGILTKRGGILCYVDSFR